MSQVDREEIEGIIGRLLLDQWDPLGVRDNPVTGGAYAGLAHEVFALLARGASDVQIARHLHRAEREEMHHPELANRDLSELVRALRAIEKKGLGTGD
jgi:hypothetical protein